MYIDDAVDISFTTFTTNINNNFSLPKGWSAELSGWYRGKGGWGLFSTGEMYGINAGVAKQVLKNKGSVKLSVRDIFNTQLMTGSARYSDVDVMLENKRDTRQVSLSFSYRFGKSNIASERKRSGGAGEEKNRVKNAGN
jgi:hypothetical protein